MFAIYVPTFISQWRREPEVALLDEVDVAVTDKLVNEDGEPVIEEDVEVVEYARGDGHRM